MMAEEEVNIPKVGRVPRSWVIVGAAAVFGLIVYEVWKSRSANNAPEPITTDTSGLPIGGGGPVPDLSADTSTGNETNNVIFTNDQWVNAVAEILSAGGYELSYIYATLGKYLSRQPLDLDEQSLVRAAWAVKGKPPIEPPEIIPKQDATPTPEPEPEAEPEPQPEPQPQPQPEGQYDSVTVVKYTSKSPPWNSTMWGIAKHYGYGSASTNYLPIWTDAKNAGLRASRGIPQHIQPGDTVYVKLK